MNNEYVDKVFDIQMKTFYFFPTRFLQAIFNYISAILISGKLGRWMDVYQ